MKHACLAALTLLALLVIPLSRAAPVEDQRAVLVTGASSGIGRSIAETLAAEGYFVYAGARKEKDIEALSALPNVQGIRLDVRRQEEIDAAVTTITEAGRGLFGLVNNAGVFLFDPLIEIREEDLAFIMDVNVFGPYRVTKAFAPLILEARGRITTTGSIASAYSGRLMGPYSMTKAAMSSFTEALSSEMRKFGVAVSIIDPGNFRSEIMRNMESRIASARAVDGTTLYRDEIQRIGTFAQADRSTHADPKPVADAVLDFMSSSAPKLRYMVTPNAREAHMTIRSSLKRALELNADQPFTLARDELVLELDKLLAAAEAK